MFNPDLLMMFLSQNVLEAFAWIGGIILSVGFLMTFVRLLKQALSRE